MVLLHPLELLHHKPNNEPREYSSVGYMRPDALDIAF